MITKSQKNKIIKILGKYYSSMVLEYLNDNNIRNKYGLPYNSNSTIVNVMNGQSHKSIETAIFKLVEIKKEENISEKIKRKTILK